MEVYEEMDTVASDGDVRENSFRITNKDSVGIGTVRTRYLCFMATWDGNTSKNCFNI